MRRIKFGDVMEVFVHDGDVRWWRGKRFPELGHVSLQRSAWTSSAENTDRIQIVVKTNRSRSRPHSELPSGSFRGNYRTSEALQDTEASTRLLIACVLGLYSREHGEKLLYKQVEDS